MSGKRLLDAIQLLNVAKSVAGKHLGVRQRQLDVFTRTSSLTKGIKAQTDGLIITAQAAAALAKRFNEPDPSDVSPKPQSADAPRPGYQQSHAAPLSPEEARRSQRQSETQIPSTAAEHTARDGASKVDISTQQDIFYKPSQESTPELSGLPRVKLPKNASDTQHNVQNEINADVFHSSAGAEKPSAEKDEIPEEMMSEIFHSPKVARTLSKKPAAGAKGPAGAPVAEEIVSAIPEVCRVILVEKHGY